MAKKKSSSRILVDIIKSLNKKELVIAEIGIWKGRTTKGVLKNCKDTISQYWAVDFWKCSDSRYYRSRPPEFWQELYFRVCKLMYWFPQLCVVRMDSLTAAKLFPERYFDLVFIDADHTYEAVMADIKAWLPLVNIGGFLTGHDYGGKKAGVKRAVDEIFGEGIEIKFPEYIWVKRVENKN